MGNSFLEKPITTKKTSWEENSLFKYSVCEMQGWRKHMEDAYISYLEVPGYPDMSIFGVFDGHGGGEVSKYVAAHFLEHFVKRKALADGNIGEALKQTFIQVQLMMKFKPGIDELIKYKEEEMKQKITAQQLEAGATAVVVVVTKQKIICANAGDSRATVCRKDKIVALSYDHKPENPIEKARIQLTGVPIIQGRVNGLNLTRSIGDFNHKKVPGLPFNKQPVICMPDIIEVERSDQDEFILIGCDGIWQKYGDDHIELTQYFKDQLQKQNSLNCLKTFFDKNISVTLQGDPYGKDNMTAILIQFKNK